MGDMIASMKTTVATRDATVVELRMAKEAAEQDGAAKAATIEAKDELIVDLEANMGEERSEDKMPTWAIAIIVVIGAVLLLVIAILGVVVSREQQGKPIFVQKNSAATLQKNSAATSGPPTPRRLPGHASLIPRPMARGTPCILRGV